MLRQVLEGMPARRKRWAADEVEFRVGNRESGGGMDEDLR